MTETLKEKLTKTGEGMRLYQQERTILEATELICKLMHEQHVSNKELARRLGLTRKYVRQLLDGQRNMTLRTVSDIFTALNHTIHFQDGPLKVKAFCSIGDCVVHKGFPPDGNPYGNRCGLSGSERQDALHAFKHGEDNSAFTYWYAPCCGGAFQIANSAVILWKGGMSNHEDAMAFAHGHP